MRALIDRIGVKSIQSGTVIPTVTYTKGSSSTNVETQKEIEIPINTVNPEKCLVLLSGVWGYSTKSQLTEVVPILSSITSEILSIKPTIEYVGGIVTGSTPTLNYGQSITVVTDCEISWQVIEFY